MPRETQLPRENQAFLDHVAHFVPDMDRAGAALERLGFRLTPFTEQMNRTEAGATPAGMANRCAMLRQGYLEFLTAVSDTPLARRFQAAVSRYTGLHLIAFAVADAEDARAKLEAEGFAPEPPVNLRRPVEMPDGTAGEARFTVVRVPPEAMPEGRIQILTHHTETAIWQARWIEQPNAVEALQAVALVVEDPAAVAARYGRFVDRPVERREDGRWRLAMERGVLVFMDAATMGAHLPGVSPPATPWIAGHALGSGDPAETRRWFAAGAEPLSEREGEASYRLPPALGGFATVTVSGVLPLWAR